MLSVLGLPSLMAITALDLRGPATPLQMPAANTWSEFAAAFAIFQPLRAADVEPGH
jgi:hypothetical protein